MDRTAEPLCKIRDVLRLISDFEIGFQAKHEIGLNEGMALCSLAKYGASTSGRIAELLGLTASNTSKVIASVEKKGLVERIIGREDKRQMYFVLTSSGEVLLKQIKAEPDTILGVIEQIRGI